MTQDTAFCGCGNLLFQGKCPRCDSTAFCSTCGRFLISILGEPRCVGCEPEWFMTRYSYGQLRERQRDLLPLDTREAQAQRRERAWREAEDRMAGLGEKAELQVIRRGLHGQFVTNDGIMISIRPAWDEARNVPRVAVTGRTGNATVVEPIATDDGDVLVIAVVPNTLARRTKFYVLDMLVAGALASKTPGFIEDPPVESLEQWAEVLSSVRFRRIRLAPAPNL